MLSRLLSGGFIGVILTLAPAYFGHTNDAYVMALKELGKKRKDTDVQVKDFLFATHLEWVLDSLLELVRVHTLYIASM